MQRRVFGIETEYAILWHARGKGSPRPTNLEIFRQIEASLARRVRTLPRAWSPLRADGACFLENGGCFDYEARPEEPEHGLLELASPECADPDALLAHERAKDELAEELAAEATRELARAGWRGEVRLGKNNVDSAGHSFGSHESYWVEDRLAPAALARFVPVWLLLWALTAPVLAAVGIVALLHRSEWLARAARRNPGALERLRRGLEIPLRPLLRLHSALYARFFLRGIRRDLTAFLVTRAIFAGAGAVAFDGGPLFRIAQRPPFLRALARIHAEPDVRPIYELRDLFMAPWSALYPRRRLHLMLGDANLCEWALWLRVATTALVLEAIETEPGAGWPELAEPLAALREVGADAELRCALSLADGTRAGALAIQRRYLERVEAVLGRASGETDRWKRTALARWRETLAALERDPESLAGRVDWIAKRALVRAELADPADQSALELRGAELIAAQPAEPELQRLRALAFRAWRADLRYAELGPRGGFRRLELRGRIQRLSAPGAVRAARSEPPADTRAFARGRAIRDAHSRELAGRADWDRVQLEGCASRRLRDPLDPQRGAE
jgi:proteasome accessory factor A